MTALSAPQSAAQAVAPVWSCWCGQATHLPAFAEVVQTPADARRHRRDVCRSHDAPSWDGKLSTLTDEQVFQRFGTLGQYVAQLEARRQQRAGGARRAGKVALALEVARWAETLLEVHREIERRAS